MKITSNRINNLINEIANDIAKSGLPLEIEVSSILSEAGWSVRNQVNYLDRETNKERPIDIIANKSCFEKVYNYDRFITHLVIECKRDEKPWVFFTTPITNNYAELMITDWDFHKHWANPPLKSEIAVLSKHSHYIEMSKERAVMHYEPFKGNKENKEKILTAKYQVTKCLMDQIEKIKHFQAIMTKLKMSMKPLVFYFPIICFEGDLFKVNLSDGIKSKPEATDYVQYEFQHMEKRFLIDIVKKEFFKQYLEHVDKEINDIKNALIKM